MAVKGIILKTARKKAGTISRAKIRSVVAAVYRNPPVTSGSTLSGQAVKVLVTKTDTKPLLTK